MNQEIMPSPQNTHRVHKSFIPRLWNWLTAPSSTLKEVGEQRAARLATTFLFVIAVLEFIGALVAAPQSGWAGSFSSGLGFSLLATILAFALAKTRWYRWAIFIFSVSFSSTAYSSIISQVNEANSSLQIFIYVPLSLIVASSFLSPWAVFLLTGLNIGALLSTTFLGATIPPQILGPQAGIITTIGLVLIFVANFRNNVEKARLDEVRAINRELESLSGTLEQRVQERTTQLALTTDQATRRAEQLSTVSDLSRSLTSIQDLDTLLQITSQLISERMGYYHTGIFLLDENQEFAVLQAANSEGGQKMLARNHRLQVGSEGIVGFVTGRGQARIALDVGADAVYFDNPDLPNTRSEVAVPLKFGDSIIGGLDIQSTEPNAFTDEDVVVFTVLADQLAIAIQNARSLEQAKAAAEEAEAASRQLIGKAWVDIRQSNPITGYRFDGLRSIPLTEKSSENPQKQMYAIPIRLRGQIIGKLAISHPGSTSEWTDDEVAIIQATAERIALAAENARLIEDAQRRAAKESLIGQISTRIGEATETDKIMATTVSELQKLLGASEISFCLADAEENSK